MDRWKTTTSSANQQLPSILDQPANCRQRKEGEAKDQISARKVQKADREKLRRDRLNEQFLELGHTLDPDRPKNDKATILIDTIQVLKDLTSEVSRLKDEFASLSDESRELMQEKNELREEKASLRAEIENMNNQIQQRIRVMFPWNAVDPSVVMPPPYSYPVHVPVPPPGSIPMHPPMQPFPFFGNHNLGPFPAPCSTFVPYSTSSNPSNEQPPSHHASTSHSSSKQDAKCKSTDNSKANNSHDVATDLELKTPGSSTLHNGITEEKQSKQSLEDGTTTTTTTTSNSSSAYSSSQDLPSLDD